MKEKRLAQLAQKGKETAWLIKSGIDAMTLLILERDHDASFTLCEQEKCPKTNSRATCLRYHDSDICEEFCEKINQKDPFKKRKVA